MIPQTTSYPYTPPSFFEGNTTAPQTNIPQIQPQYNNRPPSCYELKLACRSCYYRDSCKHAVIT